MGMKVRTSLFAVSLALVGCASADQKADVAYLNGDYQTAYAEFLPMAQGGDWLADERIAFMYAHGQGRAPDLTQAQQWYEKAALDGDVMVELSLGADAMNAPGGPNYAQAAKWFELAAEHDNTDAQLLMSVFYEHGLGVAKDEDTAAHWLNQYVARTDVVGQKVSYKYSSGGDNIGGYMKAVREVFLAAVQRAPEMRASFPNAGRVLLTFRIQDGNATDVAVAQSSGNPQADAAAVALMQKTYMPPVLASLSHVDKFSMAFDFGVPPVVIAPASH
jgi:hypothetical protein